MLKENMLKEIMAKLDEVTKEAMMASFNNTESVLVDVNEYKIAVHMEDDEIIRLGYKVIEKAGSFTLVGGQDE